MPSLQVALIAALALGSVSVNASSKQKAVAAFDRTTSFASKTAYWDQSHDALGISPHASVKGEDDFTLVQVQNVVRHGSRYPTKGNTQEIMDLLEKLQTNYASVIPVWMQNYALPYNLTVEGELASAGTAELKAYGARVRKSIGSAIPTSYTQDQFIVQHTYKPRTRDTARGFISTFFENPESVQYIAYTKDSDPLLRFYDQCPRYVRDVDENENAMIEATKFKASPAFQQNIQTLRTALNLPVDANLTTTDVESAFSACALDMALYKIENQWCSLLNEEFIKSAEYAEELESYYKSSAGFKISYEIAAVLLKDVFGYMKNFTLSQTTVVGNLRFAHAETTLPLMTLLGYADKTPLLGSATAAQIESRKFRASRLSPFMANVEFRLYRKNDDSDDAEQQTTTDAEYYVQVRINEQPTKLPGCDGKVFCKFSHVEKIWSHYLTEYDFDTDCKV